MRKVYSTAAGVTFHQETCQKFGTKAIRLWVQNLVDSHLQQMEFEDTETMSIEEACEMTLVAVREEYARS